MAGPRRNLRRTPDAVVDTAREIARTASPIPRRTSVREVDARRSVDAATSSIRDAIRFVEHEIEPRAAPSRFSREPQLILRSEADAHSHTSGLVDFYSEVVAGSSGRDVESLRLAATMPVPEGLASWDARASREISRTWLSESYLGEFIYSRFERSPPIITTEPQAFFELGDDVLGYHDTQGIYMPGTSHILISSRPMSDADRRRIILHEQLHYAAWLGGGFSIRWSAAGGHETVRGQVSWLHEGLTELHAQQLTRDRGHSPTTIAYHLETAVSYYLQRLVGPRRLRQAYLTGDFTEVRRLVDRRLGSGTFSRLTRLENGYEALVYVRGRLERAGIDYRAWSSPLADVPLISVDPSGTGN